MIRTSNTTKFITTMVQNGEKSILKHVSRRYSQRATSQLTRVISITRIRHLKWPDFILQRPRSSPVFVKSTRRTTGEVDNGERRPRENIGPAILHFQRATGGPHINLLTYRSPFAREYVRARSPGCAEKRARLDPWHITTGGMRTPSRNSERLPRRFMRAGTAVKAVERVSYFTRVSPSLIYSYTLSQVQTAAASRVSASNRSSGRAGRFASHLWLSSLVSSSTALFPPTIFGRLVAAERFQDVSIT